MYFRRLNSGSHCRPVLHLPLQLSLVLALCFFLFKNCTLQGQKDHPGVKAFNLHVAELSSIPGTPETLLRTSRNKPWASKLSNSHLKHQNRIWTLLDSERSSWSMKVIYFRAESWAGCLQSPSSNLFPSPRTLKSSVGEIRMCPLMKGRWGELASTVKDEHIDASTAICVSLHIQGWSSVALREWYPRLSQHHLGLSKDKTVEVCHLPFWRQRILL